MSKNIELKVISKSLEIGTRPHWDSTKQSLYYVDLPISKVYRYDSVLDITYEAKVGTDPLSFMFPIEGTRDKFVAALGRKFAVVTWDGTSAVVTSVDTICEIDTEPEFTSNRLNGGKVDPYGRLWAGTMGPTGPDGKTIPICGNLYSLSHRQVKRHLTNIGISNGLAWDTKTNKMYYIDTLFPGIYEFDYDHGTGHIYNQRVVFEFAKYEIPGLPDGMLIDTDDYLWIAVIHGSRVIQIDPKNGQLLQTVQIPTPQVTALTFGGKNLDTLYVTTARITIDDITPDYPAGCTYAITGLQSKGYPGDSFKL